MSPFSSSYLTISHHAAERVLTGTWHRSVMPFELQRGYAALLDEAVRRRCRFWLINLSERVSGISADDVQWMLTTYFPQLPARLRLPVYLAYVMAPHQLAGILANPGIPDLTYFSGRPYCLERFTSETAAREWLDHCRRQDARQRRRKAA